MSGSHDKRRDTPPSPSVPPPPADPSSEQEDGAIEAPARSLDEVLDLGVNVVRDGLKDLEGAVDYDDIQEVFQTAQKAIDWSNQRVPTARERAVVEQVEERLVRFEDVAKLPDEEFFGCLAALRESVGDETLQLTTDPFEDLGILLALLDEPGVTTVPTRLESYLESVPSERDRELWFSALVEMSALEHRDLFDRVMPRCTRGMRFATPSFADRLVVALQNAPTEEHYETIWPWAANELLIVDREKGQHVAQGLVQAVAALPDHLLTAALPRLLRLDAVGRGWFPADSFHPRQTELFPLWAELLGTEAVGDLAVPTVLRGLRLAPPAWTGAVALVGLWEEHPWSAPLLRQFLIEWPAEWPTPILNELASRAVMYSLDVLDPSQHGEPWTLEAVQWLETARFVPARPLLETIVRERRGLLVPTWPRAVRNAARGALKAIAEEPQ